MPRKATVCGYNTDAIYFESNAEIDINTVDDTSLVGILEQPIKYNLRIKSKLVNDEPLRKPAIFDKYDIVCAKDLFEYLRVGLLQKGGDGKSYLAIKRSIERYLESIYCISFKNEAVENMRMYMNQFHGNGVCSTIHHALNLDINGNYLENAKFDLYKFKCIIIDEIFTTPK